MSYTKNIWAIYNPDLPEEEQDNAFLSKAKLDHIEEGIETAHQLAESAKSAYQSWLDAGNTGTEAEFIAFLKGEKGDPGEQGPQGQQGIQGEKGEQGLPGEPGVTPVKGTDYFTPEDITEVVNAVLATQKNTPYYDEELNRFFACGTHINVYAAEEEGKLRVTWLSDNASYFEEAIIPNNINIFGGDASDNKVVYYPATSIAVYSGSIKTIIGGCFGNGLVGNSTIIINGGTFTQGLCGGGMHWADKNAHHNHVGHADIIINDAENIAYIYGGSSSGVCSTGVAKITINGGNINGIICAGSNGYTGCAELQINGGIVAFAQGGNRGSIGNIKITVNNGTVDRLYPGVGDTATYVKSEMFINGGTINKLAPGKYAGEENAERVSGTYVNGIVTDEAAVALNLVKVVSLNELNQRLIALENNATV